LRVSDCVVEEALVQDKLDALIKRMYDGGILYAEAVHAFRKAFMTVALTEHKGNVSDAAKALRMHRNSVSRAMEQLGISIGDLRATSRRPPTGVRQPYIRKTG
jgi:Fis family transcriptional regulator, factor for inversion stimulation protein